MTEQELIKQQFSLNHAWTLRLVKELDEAYWQQVPEGVNSTIHWQLGHMVVTQYFQALSCTDSPRDAVKENLPMPKYIQLFGRGTDPIGMPENVSKAALLQALDLIYQQVLRAIDGLDSAALDAPVAVAHPLAKTKREALSWCSHHQAWHNGQIALMKRMLTGKSF